MNEINWVADFAQSHKTEYIEPLYRGPSKTFRTEIWMIKSLHGNDELGEVRWLGRWRQYSFFPSSDTTFSASCMNDIAKICEDLTKRQRMVEIP